MSVIATKIRYITYLLVAISVIVPLIRPLGLPIPITPTTRQAYEAIQNLPEGTVILIYTTIGGPNWPELGPCAKIVLQQLVDLPVKFIIYSQFFGSSLMYETKIIAKMDMKGKEYGVDYVDIGYIAGEETALAAWVDDIHKTSSQDYFGNPISSLPMMKNIRTGADIDFVIVIGHLEPVLRQVQALYGTPVTCFAWANVISFYMPYVISGQVSGLVPGLKGAGEYELLMKSPGVGAASSDAISITHLLVIGIIIYGNYDYLKKKGKRQKDVQGGI